MATAEELVVAIRSEGADETESDLQTVEDQLEETTGQMGDQADQMGEFSTKFRGAMSAVVAGLAVATGGILSQVPVVGEVFEGLGAIIEMLAISLGEDLRPVLGNVSQDLFELADQLDPEEGILSNLDTLASGLADIAGTQIEVAITSDAIGLSASQVLEFVFPEINEGSLLNAVFSFDLSAAAVLTAVFGSGAIGTSRLLGFVFGSTIGAPTILAAVFATVTAGAILSHIFDDVNMTEASIVTAVFGGVFMTASVILSSIFGGITMTSALILGTIFAGLSMSAAKVLDAIFPNLTINESKLLGYIFGGLAITAGAILTAIFGGITMTAGLILGAIFAGVVVTGAAIIDAIDWPNITVDDLVKSTRPEGGDDGDGGSGIFIGPTLGGLPPLQSGGVVTGPTPAMVGEGSESEAVLPLSTLDSMLRHSGGGSSVMLDGRDVQEQTGRYEFDNSTVRGGGP